LLQPRLIDASTGNTPLLGRWSGSDKSINTSIYSGTLIATINTFDSKEYFFWKLESDRPLSSLYDGESGVAGQRGKKIMSQYFMQIIE